MKTSHRHALPIAAAAAATVGLILLASKKKKKQMLVQSSSVRKPNQTSHICIPTANAKETSQFFQSFGMVQVSSSDEKIVILSCPNPKKKMHQPFVVLEEIPSFEPAKSTNASNVGIGRLCLGVKNVYETVEWLKQECDMHPIAPPVCDKPGTPNAKGENKEPEVVIVGYRDASSGVLLELVSLSPTLALDVAIRAAQLVMGLEFPIFVHANVNVSNYSTGLAAYQALGYSEIAKHYGTVKNNLYKALEIPDPGIAKEVTLIKSKEETPFCIDLIEWDETTKPSVQTTENPMRIAFTVKDLPNFVDELVSKKSKDGQQQPYWTGGDSPIIKEFPAPLGKAIVSSIQDPDGLKVDLVEYPLSTINLQVPSKVEDKVVFITGCDSGFGRSLACRMSLLGFSVVAACYSPQGAKYLSQIVTTTIVADLETTDGVQKAVQACRDALKGPQRQLWAIVNNAGVCFPGNVEWLRPQLYQKTMQINFHAAVSIIHELIPDIKACPGSRIINVSSVCGMLAQPTNSAYCAAKHALEAYSDCLRGELHPYDCHVVVVQPATMKTPLAMSYWDVWYTGYKEAPAERQALFEKKKLDTFVDGHRAMLQAIAEDPTATTDAMVKALLEPKPPTRLRTGAIADGFFYMSQKPDAARDSMLWAMMKFDDVHVPVEGTKA